MLVHVYQQTVGPEDNRAADGRWCAGCCSHVLTNEKNTNLPSARSHSEHSRVLVQTQKWVVASAAFLPVHVS